MPSISPGDKGPAGPGSPGLGPWAHLWTCAGSQSSRVGDSGGSRVIPENLKQEAEGLKSVLQWPRLGQWHVTPSPHESNRHMRCGITGNDLTHCATILGPKDSFYNLI